MSLILKWKTSCLPQAERKTSSLRHCNGWGPAVRHLFHLYRLWQHKHVVEESQIFEARNSRRKCLLSATGPSCFSLFFLLVFKFCVNLESMESKSAELKNPCLLMFGLIQIARLSVLAVNDLGIWKRQVWGWQRKDSRFKKMLACLSNSKSFEPLPYSHYGWQRRQGSGWSGAWPKFAKSWFLSFWDTLKCKPHEAGSWPRSCHSRSSESAVCAKATSGLSKRRVRHVPNGRDWIKPPKFVSPFRAKGGQWEKWRTQISDFPVTMADPFIVEVMWK